MSTSTHPTDTARTVRVPAPRRAADPPVHATTEQESGNRQAGHDEAAGLFARHEWLVPASGIGAIVATYTAMIVLTWAAGGPTPFS